MTTLNVSRMQVRQQRPPAPKQTALVRQRRPRTHVRPRKSLVLKDTALVLQVVPYPRAAWVWDSGVTHMSRIFEVHIGPRSQPLTRELPIRDQLHGVGRTAPEHPRAPPPQERPRQPEPLGRDGRGLLAPGEAESCRCASRLPPPEAHPL